MKYTKDCFKLTLLAAGLLLGSVLNSAAKPLMVPPPHRVAGDQPTDGPMRSPAPITVDRIIQDQGNIVTTVDNYGYIGGWSYYDLPSGEYPRNSGHDYIGEIMYWMGGVTDDGDTLVANTEDDFQAIPSLINSTNENLILLSTDTTRYYEYSLNDTVGAGIGNPAHGWRIWSGEANDWVYTDNYVPAEDTVVEGGPIAVQESHYRFADDALGSPVMGLEMTHTILQWNYCYNEDFMFVIIEITNASDNDYHDFSFGLYTDIDVGGPDGTGENGRLGDLVGSDSTANLGWIYDADGYDVGWGRSVETGIMGTKYLEISYPDDTGRVYLGMTAFRTGDWALVPEDDEGRFDLINSNEFDASLPPTDQYYIQCTHGIELAAGTTIRVVYAIIAGEDEADFRANADLAQQLYDNRFVGPQPPPTPTLRVQAGDHKVYLAWDDAAQTGADPLSGVNDFAGYKLYRSSNLGKSWGREDREAETDCRTLDYDRIAEWEVADPSDPIARSYIDTGLVNGLEYWYCLSAYDIGDTILGVEALQTGFGSPAAPNIVAVMPRTDPAGFYEAAGTVEHVYSGLEEPSAGSVYPTVFDRSALLGADYAVVFQDDPDASFWHLINVTTGDTVLANQTMVSEDPEMYAVAEGLRVVVRDADIVPRSMTQTAQGGAEATLIVPDEYFYGTVPGYFYDVTFGHQHYRSTYELRYTGDSTLAPALNDPVGVGLAWSVPFQAWNVSTNQRVALAVYDFGLDGAWDPWDLIIIIDYPYDPVTDPFETAWPYYFSWFFGFDDAVYDPAVGDVFTIQGPLLNGPDDSFTFSVDGVNDVRAKQQLSNIKVVPNPFYAHAIDWEQRQGDQKIEFQHLPDACTIRIYTLSGDLVKTLDHNDGSGTEAWNLLSDRQQQVASGIFIYHVESQYGDRVGRFAVVK